MTMRIPMEDLVRMVKADDPDDQSSYDWSAEYTTCRVKGCYAMAFVCIIAYFDCEEYDRFYLCSNCYEKFKKEAPRPV